MSIICVLPVISAFYDLLAALRVPFGAFDALLKRIWHRFGLPASLKTQLTGESCVIQGLWRNSERIWSGLFGAIQWFRRPFKHIRSGQIRHRTGFFAIWNTFRDRLNVFGRPPALLTPSISVLSIFRKRIWALFEAFGIFRNAFGRRSGLLAYFATHLTSFETHSTLFGAYLILLGRINAFWDAWRLLSRFMACKAMFFHLIRVFWQQDVIRRLSRLFHMKHSFLSRVFWQIIVAYFHILHLSLHISIIFTFSLWRAFSYVCASVGGSVAFSGGACYM